MNYFKYQKFIHDLKKRRVSKDERALLRQELFEEIGLNESSYAVSYIRTSHVRAIGVVALAVVVFVITPLSYAAEGAVPGDLLYPIKTHVNEKVRRIATEVARRDTADFEIHLLEQKIQETEKLISEKKLEGQRKEQTRKAVSSQLDKVLRSSRINTIEELELESRNDKALEKARQQISNVKDALEDTLDVANQEKRDRNHNEHENVEDAQDNAIQNDTELRDHTDDEKDNTREKEQEEHRDKQNERIETKKKELENILNKHKDTLRQIDLPRIAEYVPSLEHED